MDKRNGGGGLNVQVAEGPERGLVIVISVNVTVPSRFASVVMWRGSRPSLQKHSSGGDTGGTSALGV